MACSSTVTPSTTPGARKAFCARRLVRTGNTIARTFAQA
jgi:hypothetical protein